MKRPRSAITALSLFATIVLSPTRKDHQFASGASLRASSSSGDDKNDRPSSGGGFGSAVPLHQMPIPRDGSSSNSVVSAAGASSTKTKKKTQPTATLSISSHPRATTASGNGSDNDTPEIPLIGIGVGNLPHAKVPYMLGSALMPSSMVKRNKSHTGESLEYRLIDTSHTDSALEVLVGRSLSRLSSTPSAGGSTGANKGGDGDDEDKVYHVMIKIWHTHLGYERTVLSVQDSLSDILPSANSNSGGGGKGKGKAKKKTYKQTQDTASTEGPDVRIHAILQYPRCYDDLFSTSAYLNSPNFPIKYTNCQEEEDALDVSVKQISAGGSNEETSSSPLLDKANAWKRSYRALEELYHHGALSSIGISNFGPSDLAELFDVATVGPHVYQGTLHTLMYQRQLVEDLVKHGVHYQCYDAVSSILEGRDSCKRAWSKLELMGARHGTLLDGDAPLTDSTSTGGVTSTDGNIDTYGYSAIQVVLGYLIHHRGVGVVSGTTNIAHLVENSPSSLANMPKFTPRQVLDIETSIMALLNGEDLAEHTLEDVINSNGSSDGTEGDEDELNAEEGRMVATIFNTLPHPRSIRMFQIHPETGEQIQLSHSIPSGRSGRLIVNVDDVLVAYDGHGTALKKFLVGENGEGEDGSVDFTVGSS